jgi:hypothetical protein
MYSYDTLTQALNDLKKRGYTENFSLRPFSIECPSLALQLNPEEFTIDEYYRFEGNSDPDDNSIVYAISGKDGLKGVLVDAYGVYAENMTPEMAAKMQVAI